MGHGLIKDRRPWTLRALRFMLSCTRTTSARKQKRYWREPLTKSVAVLNIGMLECINSEDDINVCQDLRPKSMCDAARAPLSDDRLNNDSLDTADSLFGLVTGHPGRRTNDARKRIG